MRKRRTLDDCAAELRRRDSDRFLTTLFAPPERRSWLCGLYLLNYEVARTAEVVHEPLLGQVRLQWWREAVTALAGRDPKAKAAARTHPALGALAPAAASGRLAAEDLLLLIEARERDLEGGLFPDLDALEAYAEATSASLVRAAARLLSEVETSALHRAARHVGVAWALTGLLRAVPFHAASGRLYLPADHLAAVGLEPSEVLAGRSSAALAGVIMRLASRARDHLAAGRAASADLPRELLPALLTGNLAGLYLSRLQSLGYDPFDPALGRPTSTRVLRLWSASLRGRF